MICQPPQIWVGHCCKLVEKTDLFFLLDIYVGNFPFGDINNEDKIQLIYPHCDKDPQRKMT